MRYKFVVGQRINKRTGYRFPGVVVCRFRTTKGDERYVVEATGRSYRGMLHIFSPEQLKAIP